MLLQSYVNFPICCHNITGIVLNQLQTKGVKARVAPLTITLNDPHGDFVPPITTVLGFAGFEVTCPGDTESKESLEWIVEEGDQLNAEMELLVHPTNLF